MKKEDELLMAGERRRRGVDGKNMKAECINKALLYQHQASLVFRESVYLVSNWGLWVGRHQSSVFIVQKRS
ncbi:hypothetical protein ACN38_g8161 [Penicillium nordicum]|uniref:Uncharacterized protein n=1 Tax=Penicillium nordicum TaxID=229535 RepID=A0A0M9WDP9_9EURO|nr:hypothetical protein ACN38_g8161 [Penicillium nordicum]